MPQSRALYLFLCLYDLYDLYDLYCDLHILCLFQSAAAATSFVLYFARWPHSMSLYRVIESDATQSDTFIATSSKGRCSEGRCSERGAVVEQIWRRQGGGYSLLASIRISHSSLTGTRTGENDPSEHRTPSGLQSHRQLSEGELNRHEMLNIACRARFGAAFRRMQRSSHGYYNQRSIPPSTLRTVSNGLHVLLTRWGRAGFLDIEQRWWGPSPLEATYCVDSLPHPSHTRRAAVCAAQT